MTPSNRTEVLEGVGKSSAEFLLNWLLLLPEMGFGTLVGGLLLFANALAILNEERFLARWGWTLGEIHGGRRNSLKGQVVGLIHACQFMRLPLIVLNIISIGVMLVTG